jgi:hypothetical protein
MGTGDTIRASKLVARVICQQNANLGKFDSNTDGGMPFLLDSTREASIDRRVDFLCVPLFMRCSPPRFDLGRHRYSIVVVPEVQRMQGEEEAGKTCQEDGATVRRLLWNGDGFLGGRPIDFGEIDLR